MVPGNEDCISVELAVIIAIAMHCDDIRFFDFLNVGGCKIEMYDICTARYLIENFPAFFIIDDPCKITMRSFIYKKGHSVSHLCQLLSQKPDNPFCSAVCGDGDDACIYDHYFHNRLCLSQTLFPFYLPLQF